MEVITLESEVYKSLAGKIDRIARFIQQMEQNTSPTEPDPAQMWFSNDEAAEMLQISTRTLQRMRSAGEITYSIKGGKVQYTQTEIRRMTSGKVFQRKNK